MSEADPYAALLPAWRAFCLAREQLRTKDNLEADWLFVSGAEERARAALTTWHLEILRHAYTTQVEWPESDGSFFSVLPPNGPCVVAGIMLFIDDFHSITG